MGFFFQWQKIETTEYYTRKSILQLQWTKRKKHKIVKVQNTKVKVSF